MDANPVWEPPLAGTDAEQLLGALDRLRYTFRWKADGLDAAGLAFRIPSSELSIGGLLKHLAAVESAKFTLDLDGGVPDAPFTFPGHDESWAFTSASDDSPAELYALYDSIVARSRARVGAAVEAGGLDQHVALGEAWGLPVSLRRLVTDLIEEYGRHTGHADLLREAIDGRVGEDPPSDWLPSGWLPPDHAHG